MHHVLTETARWLLPPKMLKSIIGHIERLRYTARRIHCGEEGNRLIYEALTSGRPQAIGKLGSTETLAIRKYRLTLGRPDAAERSARSRRTLYTHSGVYPDDYAIYARFCQYMLDDVLPEMTMLAVWFNLGEAKIVNRSCREAQLLDLFSLDPYRFEEPWSRAMAGKRVLAVHPFADTIRQQHARLAQVWVDSEVAPPFTLECVRVPHYPTMVRPRHHDWFATLDQLKLEMAEKEFDVALIGAGAYSLPLAVHAKILGKQGIHLGGGTQIIFGIRGGRWDADPYFQKLFNASWCRPLVSDTPPNNESVEGGCYW
jgi:hypothetical protein